MSRHGMIKRAIGAALLAAALLFAFSQSAMADSWPTSFGFADSVTLKVQLAGDGAPRSHTLQPYRGTSHGRADALAITNAALREIGAKGTTYGKVYNLVQLVDSLGFNNSAAANQIYKQFEQGLVRMTKAGDGNGKLALAVHTVYRQLRDAGSVTATEQAWHPTRKQQAALGRRLQMGKKYNPRAQLKAMQVNGAPAIDLIVSALRNDVAYQLGFEVAKTDKAKATTMFARSERDFARAVDKVLLSGRKASRSARKGIRSFAGYGQYFKEEAPLFGQAMKVFAGKGKNPAKRLQLQRVYTQRMDQIGRRAIKLPSFRGTRMRIKDLRRSSSN